MATNSADDQNSQYNPAEQDWADENIFKGDGSDLANAENEAANEGSESGRSIGGEFADKLSNISKAKDLEGKSGGPTHKSSIGGGLKDGAKTAKNLATKNKAQIILKLKDTLRDKGPIGTVIAILVSFAAICLMFFATPANLWASVKANLTNARDMASPARNMRYTRILAYQIPKQNASFDDINKACEKPKSRKCRALTMSDHMRKRLEKAGMVVETEKHEKSGRYMIKSITMTDDFGREHKITNRAEFQAAFKRPTVRAIFNRSFDGARSMFFSNNFRDLLSKRFKTSKASKLDGKDKNELDKSFRKGMRLDGEPANGDPDKRKKNREKQGAKVKGLTNKIKGLTQDAGIVSLVCGAYHSAKAIVASAKAIQIANLVRFTMIFFTEFDRAIAGDITQEASEYIGNRLNYSEFNKETDTGEINRFYNTTFTDAEGMRTLLHGDIRNLSDYAKNYVVGGGKIGHINNTLTKIENFVGGEPFSIHPGSNEGNFRNILSKITGRNLDSYSKTGRLIIVELCRTIEAGGTITDIIQCTRTIGRPIQALAVGLVIAPILCGAIVIAIEKIMSEIIGTFIDDIINWIVEWLSDMSLDDETNGIDAGNAMAAGIGLLMQNTAQTNGLVATNEAGYKQYLANVASEHSEYIASLREEARHTPFDTTNQYSFLGSILTSFHGTRGMNVTSLHPVSVFKNTLATLPLATKKLAAVTPNASALSGTFGAIREFDEREAKCEDPSLTDDFAGDPFCVPYTHMAQAGLIVDPVDLIDYMVDNEFIDEETGSARSDTKNGEILKKFNKFCVSRTMPPGELDEGGSEDGSIEVSIDDAEIDTPDKRGSVSQDDDNKDRDSFREKMMLTDWQSGYNCSYANEQAGTNNEMLAYLSAYRMDNLIHDDMDNDQKKGSSEHELADGGSGEWAKPTEGPCLSGFGPRWGTMHAGLDISPPAGTPILAPDKMKVIYATDKGDGYGNSVVGRQEGGEGYMFRFGHALELKVKDGDVVDRATVIATVGSTGDSTGPHLHFEIYTKDSPDGAYNGNGTALDPYPILKEHGVDVGGCTPN